MKNTRSVPLHLFFLLFWATSGQALGFIGMLTLEHLNLNLRLVTLDASR